MIIASSPVKYSGLKKSDGPGFSFMTHRLHFSPAYINGSAS